ADAFELLGRTGREEVVRRVALGSGQVAADQQLVDVLRGLLGTAHQGHLVAHDVGDDTGEQRVVRAAQDQGVDAPGGERVEVLVGHGDQLVSAGHARFDEVDEARASAGGEGDVGGGGEGVVVGQRLGRGVGADDADVTVPGGSDRAPGGRQDHLDDGYGVPLAGVAEHGRPRG